MSAVADPGGLHRKRPPVTSFTNALLAADTDSLAAHDIASAATRADKFQDSNIGGAQQKHTRILAGTVASDGPAADCVVDKIEEFAAELAKPVTDQEEQVVALKFLLHFVDAFIGRQRPRRQQQKGFGRGFRAENQMPMAASRTLVTRQLLAFRRIRDDRHGRRCPVVEQGRRAPCVRSEQGAWEQ
jgi:hypothetical protein